MSDDVSRKVMWFTFGLAGLFCYRLPNLANLQLVRTAREVANMRYVRRSAPGGCG